MGNKLGPSAMETARSDVRRKSVDEGFASTLLAREELAKDLWGAWFLVVAGSLLESRDHVQLAVLRRRYGVTGYLPEICIQVMG